MTPAAHAVLAGAASLLVLTGCRREPCEEGSASVLFRSGNSVSKSGRESVPASVLLLDPPSAEELGFRAPRVVVGDVPIRRSSLEDLRWCGGAAAVSGIDFRRAAAGEGGVGSSSAVDPPRRRERDRGTCGYRETHVGPDPLPRSRRVTRWPQDGSVEP